MLALAAALLLTAHGPAHGPVAYGPAPADTTDRPAVDPEATGPEAADPAAAAEEAITDAAEEVGRFRVRPVFSPSWLYSASKGLGIGGGIAVDDVLARGDHVQVEARLAQRLVGGLGEYLTGEPGARRLVLGLGAAGWTTSRTTFRGHGPRSDPDGRLFLDRVAAEAEARLVWSPAGPRGVRLQPAARFHYDRLRGVEPADGAALAAVRPDDLARLQALQGEGRSGVELALGVISDTRDVPAMPRRGHYAEAEAARFQAVGGSGLGFWRAQATALAFRPALFRIPFLPERGALFVRATGVVTRQDGDRPLPWVYLPELDRDLLVGYPRSEFAGRDALSVGAGVRGVIGEAIGAFLFEGVAFGQLGAGYDDVFSEFTPRVRFTSDAVGAGERVPLRPSLAVGLNLHYLDRERPVLGALIGVGPGGVALGSLRLIHGLGVYRPRLR